MTAYTAAGVDVDMASEAVAIINRRLIGTQKASVIGHVSAIDPSRAVRLPQYGIVGRGRHFDLV